MLTFPRIRINSEGNTYARIRLSTDAAAANSTGPASDGEVEDYVFTITTPGLPNAASVITINSNTSGGPVLDNADRFGNAVASLGDIDGDGVNDLAVGVGDLLVGAERANSGRGVVHLVLLNSDGSTKSSQTVGNGSKSPSDQSAFSNGGFLVATSSLFRPIPRGIPPSSFPLGPML